MNLEFNSLYDLKEAFPTDQSCVDHFRTLRWPNGAVCHECGSTKVYTLKGEGHKCGDCGQKFTVRHNTIFAESKLALRKWYMAIFLLTSHKKGIASTQLAKDIGITQKSAWHVLHRIREATMTDEFKRPLLSGTIEMDETFVGGKEQNKHKDKRTPFASGHGSVNSKIVVFGMLQRGGELRMQKIEHIRRKDVEDVVTKNVKMNAKVHTDEATHYTWMGGVYEHSLVKHGLDEYVRGDVTTNGIEGVFAHFKRSVIGVYHQASDEHIDRYLGMFGWRWTRRKMGEGERVNALLKSTPGHQLTYKKLTRKVK